LEVSILCPISRSIKLNKLRASLATVMPHALFLGSHLATVDRLDVAPRPPLEHSRPFLRSFPRKDLLDKLLKRWRPGNPANASRPSIGRPSTPSEVRRQSEDANSRTGRTGRNSPIDEEIEHMIMKDQVRYEAEMNTFDRVKFASIHIGHATVGAIHGLRLKLNDSELKSVSYVT
jgi:metal iron transporter